MQWHGQRLRRDAVSSSGWHGTMLHGLQIHPPFPKPDQGKATVMARALLLVLGESVQHVSVACH